MVSVGSGKGGVGKTWMAASIAITLARLGKRTLLFDGDLSCPNVDVQLGLTPETDIAAVVVGWVELEDAVVVDPGHPSSNQDLDVICGRSGSGALAELPAEQVVALIESLARLAQKYDHVIVDLPTGIDDLALRLSAACQKCIVVASDLPAAMTDSYAFIKILSEYAPKVETSIAINMADTKAVGRRTYEAIARAARTFLKFKPPLAGIVLHNNDVRDAVRMQASPIDVYPNSQVVGDVKSIVKQVFGV